MQDRDLNVLLKDLGYDEDFIGRLTEPERKYILKILSEEIEEGRSRTLESVWAADYREIPVDIDTFIDDDYYLGSILNRTNAQGQIESSIYPAWREELRKIFQGEVKEVVLTGAIGIGKTTIGVLILLYDIYRMSCLHNPHSFYRLVKGSTIAIGLYNVFKYKTETTSFPLLRSWVERSPYFQERFAVDPKKKTKIIFPHNIIVISGSSELHAIGDNLYGALIDEANFFRAGPKGEKELDQALALHQSVKRRQESRFVQQPGILCLLSSTRFQSSYTTEYIAKNRDNPRVHISSFALWDVKPRDLYSGKTFKIQLGTERTSPKILEGGEEPDMGAQVIEVPVEHRDPFLEDIEAALRDVAGIATYGYSTLLPSRERAFQCVDESRKHPFIQESLTIPLDTPHSISDFVDTNSLFMIRMSQYVPKLNPNSRRFVHIDLALTGCAVGFAMGHVEETKVVQRHLEDGSVHNDYVPSIVIDMMLQIQAPKNSETDLGKIREFIFWLQAHGYNIEKVTYDGFQSADSIQILRKAGINAELLSVDRTEPKNPDAAYICLRNAIMQKHISYYYYEPFLDELFNLQYDHEKRKVDHGARMITISKGVVEGSKDVSDAVAGVVYHCYQAVTKSISSVPLEAITAATDHTTDYRLKDIEWLFDDYDRKPRDIR